MDDRKRRRLKRALRIFMLLTLCFIWGNSLLGREESAELSSSFYRWLIEHGCPIKSEHVLRKMAHFGEFGLLGMELSGLTFLRDGFRRRPGMLAALAALLIAAADETIQFFSGRAARITDVLLDFSGALTGILFLSLLVFLIMNHHKNDA